jgi:hypothetical protein
MKNILSWNFLGYVNAYYWMQVVSVVDPDPESIRSGRYVPVRACRLAGYYFRLKYILHNSLDKLKTVLLQSYFKFLFTFPSFRVWFGAWVRASDCQCQSRTVPGLITASFDTMESRKKIQKIPFLFSGLELDRIRCCYDLKGRIRTRKKSTESNTAF